MILPALLLASLLAIFLSLPGNAPEPVYQGRRLSKWLQLGRNPDGSLTSASTEALRGIGTNALPTLLKMASCTDSRLKQNALAFLARHS